MAPPPFPLFPQPAFSGIGTALGLVVALHAIALRPVLGRRRYARLKAGAASDPTALVKAFRNSIIIGWASAAVVLVILATSPRLSAASLGLRWPTGPHARSTEWEVAEIVAIIAVSAVFFRRRALSGKAIPGQRLFSALLPRTPAQRRMALLGALTAGITEEIVYRGLFTALGLGLFGLTTFWATAVAVAIFGLGHIYQGWAGLILTSVAGAILAALYLATGSLLLPIIVHIAIDVRSLVIVPAGGLSAAYPADAR